MTGRQQAWIAFGLAGALAGCAHVEHQPLRVVEATPTAVDCMASDACNVVVDATTGRPTEHVHARANRVTILAWHIPVGSNLKFARPAVTFAADSGITCKPNQNPTRGGRTVICRNEGKPNDDGHKYTVHFEGREAIDPWVWNF
jgi:hypothetical protein